MSWWVWAAGPAAMGLCVTASAQTPTAVDPAPADKPPVTLSHEMAATCKAEGGCYLLTKQALDALVLRAWREGHAQGQQDTLKSCRRTDL